MDIDSDLKDQEKLGSNVKIEAVAAQGADIVLEMKDSLRFEGRSLAGNKVEIDLDSHYHAARIASKRKFIEEHQTQVTVKAQA